MSKSKAFTAGLVLGGIAAGVAVLFAAPSSGKDLRKKLKEKGMDLKDSLEGIKEDSVLLKDQIVQTAKESKDIFIELKEDVQTAFSKWSDDTEPNKENIELELQEIRKTIDALQNTTAK